MDVDKTSNSESNAGTNSVPKQAKKKINNGINSPDTQKKSPKTDKKTSPNPRNDKNSPKDKDKQVAKSTIKPKEAPKQPKDKPVGKKPTSRKATAEDLFGSKEDDIDKKPNQRDIIKKTLEATLEKGTGTGIPTRANGAKIDSKSKEEALDLAEEMINGGESASICLSHLKKILEIALKHNKEINEKKPDQIALRQCFMNVSKLNSIGTGKGSVSQRSAVQLEKIEKAKEYQAALLAVYNAYKEKILKGDITWLDCDNNNNREVEISHNKGKEKLQLSRLFKFLNEADDPNILQRAIDLEYNMWSIFSQLADSDEDKKKYKNLALQCQSASPESKLQDLSVGVRDHVLEQGTPGNTDELIGSVVKHMTKNGLGEVITGFREKALDGTLDVNDIIRQVDSSVRGGRNDEEQDETKETERDDGEKETK